jgi:DNA-3-methyladenine glycosylase I
MGSKTVPPKNVELKRCPWCGEDPLYRDYHDLEWGSPLYDNHQLFEFLVLEGAQAGLAWITVLRKREAYRRAFDGFDPYRIARYSPERKAKLMKNIGLIRNRLKIDSAVRNAQAYVAMERAGEDFSTFLWSFVGGKPITNHWQTLAEVPVSTPESEAMSRALKKRGFNFVGPTICYAFMQATGMVNDHLVGCYRHNECSDMAVIRPDLSPP